MYINNKAVRLDDAFPRHTGYNHDFGFSARHAMDIIQDFLAMRSLASEVLQIQSDFITTCDNLDSLVESMDGSWQGAAQIEFASAYSSINKKLREMGSRLESFAKAVQSTASITEETEKNKNKNKKSC